MSAEPLTLLLNVLAIAIVCFVLHNIAVSAFVTLLSTRFLKLQVKSRKITLWFLATLPWFSAFSTAAYFVYAANGLSPFESASSMDHWHHIDSFSWFSWHGAVTACALVFLVYVISSRLLKLRAHQHEIKSLMALSHKLDNNTFEIDSNDAAAFTAGFISPKCFVTKGMREQISETEYHIVMQHELAHANKRDPLKKWLFALLAAFFIPNIKQRLVLHMTLAMEQDADNAVVSNTTSTLDIAGTLVKVARLNATGSTLKNTDMVANFGADVLAQRVYFLLGQLSLKPVNHLLMMLLAVAAFFLCLTSVDSIHHFIETFTSH